MIKNKMAKKIFILVSSLTISCICYAQEMNNVRKVIDTLCSKEMYGRGYIFNGDIKAANYIQNEFSSIGLKKIGNNFQQKFNLDINTFKSEQKLKVNGKKLKLGVDYILSPNSGSGLGITKTITFKKFKKVKTCKNKGLVLTNSEYKELIQNKELLNKAITSSVIIRINKNKLTASLAQYQLPIPIIEILSKEEIDIKKIDFDIKSELKRNYKSQNVIGMIEGTLQPDSLLILCAHYDHLGGMGDIYFPGANDNAAGIAMLIETAKHYKNNPPKYSMIFIAFGGEEAGLVGSKFFVQNPIINLNKIKFLINMDLVGTGEKGITVVNGKVFTEDYNKLISINSKMDLLSQIKSRGKAANSDHYYFTEKGVPSFFIYAMGEPGHYHDINDNGSDLKLEKFGDIFQLIISFYK